jgi:phage-related protein
MVAAVFSGFFIFDNKSKLKASAKTKSKEVENAVASKASYQKTKPTIQPDDPNYIYHVKIKEISALRETLLRKKEEIRQLKNRYQQGIEEL